MHRNADLTAAEVTEPGTYWYRDPLGAPIEKVLVWRDGDELVARFDIAGELDDMTLARVPGWFDGPLPR